MTTRTRQSSADRRANRTAQPRATAEERRFGGRGSGWDGALHEFVVQKPFCAPCRSRVYTALNPYGIPVFRYEEWTDKISIKDAATLWRIELKTFENLKYGIAAVGFLPLSQAARLSVPANRARFAYYLLRSNLLAVVSGGERWTNDNHAQKLPKAWNQSAGIQAAVALEMNTLVPPGKGKAWVESTCDDGNELWKQIQEIKQKEQERKRK